MNAVRAFRSRIARGDFARSVLTIVIGTGLSQGIIILSAPIMTRLYSPTDYGLYAVASSIMGILISITCLRFEYVVPLPGDDQAAADALALSMVANVGVTIVAFVVLVLFQGKILGALGGTAIGGALVLVSFGQLAGGAVSALTNWAIRTKDFAAIAQMRMSQSVAMVAVQVGLGLVGMDHIGLLIGAVVSRIAGSGRLLRSAMASNAAELRGISWSGIKRIARRYQRFAMLSTPAALLNALGLQLPTLVLVALYGAPAGGLFALADRICSAPLQLVAGAVGNVFLAEASRNARTSPAAIRGLFLRTTWQLVRLGTLPTIALAIVAPLVSGFILGTEWETTGIYVAILTPMYFMTFIATATGDALYALERMDLQLLRETLRVLGLGGSVVVASMVGLPETGAIVALSIGGTITYFLYTMITWWAINHTHLYVSPVAAPDSDLPDDVDEEGGSPSRLDGDGAGAWTADALVRVSGGPVVRLLTPRGWTRERDYVAQLVLGEWLGIPHRREEHDGGVVRIERLDIPGLPAVTAPDVLFSVPDGDWTGAQALRTRPAPSVRVPPGAVADGDRVPDPLPVPYGTLAPDGLAWTVEAGAVALRADVFGSVFALVTLLEEFGPGPRDAHDRFPLADSWASKEGVVERPLADDLVDVLWLAMRTAWPDLAPRDGAYELCLTHDVDRPWSAMGRAPAAVLRSIAADVVFRGDVRLAIRRAEAALDAREGRVDRDPVASFDFLASISERHGLRSTFYFQAGTEPGDPDFRYRLADPAFDHVLRDLHERGHEIGLHGSYGSYISVSRLAHEAAALRERCRSLGFDQDAWGGRQHFLRFRNPDTWRCLAAAGLTHDSTVGYASAPGFRSGTCREHPVFDLVRRRTLPLRERPLAVMDVSLLGYQGMDWSSAVEATSRVVEQVRGRRGKAVVLVHNDSVAGDRARSHYRELVEELAR